MPVLDGVTAGRLREIFAAMDGRARILYFRAGEGYEYSRELDELLREISELSSGKVEVRAYEPGSGESRALSIPLLPALVLHGREEYNVRYFGLPLGYEFGVLVDAIRGVASGRAEMSPRARSAIESIRVPVRVVVFVTPSCPYCTWMARAAHKFAIANRMVVGDVVEVSEFPELAERYEVYAVPKVVVEVEGAERDRIEGAMPEDRFAAYLASLASSE